MKKTIFFIALIAFVTLGSCNQESAKKDLQAAESAGSNEKNNEHIGTWEGIIDGQTVSLMLAPEHVMEFKMGGQIIGKETPDSNGECRYEIDYSKDPIWFDILACDATTHEEIGTRLKGILKFESENKIVVLLNFEDKRYTDFESNKTDIMYLTKVK